MLDSNAVAGALVSANSVIDKLELETGIAKSERDFLADYQSKLGAGPTRKDEDMHFLRIFKRWALHIHKQ
jgi:hypothetical protein